MKTQFKVVEGKRTPVEMTQVSGTRMPKTAHIVSGHTSVVDVAEIGPEDTVADLYSAVSSKYMLSLGTFSLSVDGRELSVSDVPLLTVTDGAKEFRFDLLF